VQRNSQGAFVYLIKTNQTVALQAVQPLATEGDLTAVKGLKPGQRIAADNFNRLQEGARVSLRQSSAATNSSPANAFSKNLRSGEMQ
jgi:multidrug efflux system membrane fusion protein